MQSCNVIEAGLMNNKILQSVRGTHDYYGDDMALMRHIMQVNSEIASLYGFSEMQTPIFEFSDVFHRSLGETSDVVSKETYTFQDRGGDSLTLRPEFTAAIVRAFISGGHTQQLPFKAFYAGAAFRYERPQKGRMRQFHQIGAECLGAKEPWQDVEIIALANSILHQLCGDEFCNQHIILKLNTLGDVDSRLNYRTALVDYLTPLCEHLSDESKLRLQKNPLRILDSKQAQDQLIVANAPKLIDYLSDKARNWFAAVQLGLDELGIAYIITPELVRGLDYYAHSVFEFTSSQLGAQATVLAGGHYNGLVAQIAGGGNAESEIAGVGFAAGIERLMLLLQQQNWQPTKPSTKIALFCADAGNDFLANNLSRNDFKLLKMVQNWRNNGINCEIITTNNFSKALKKAESIKATHVVIYETETANIRVMDLVTKQKTDYIGADDLLSYL